MQYCRWGRIKLLYKIFNIFWGKNRFNLHIIPSDLDIVFDIFCTCPFHVKCWSIVNPKKSNSVTRSIICSFKFSCGIRFSMFRCLWWKIINFVFLTLAVMEIFTIKIYQIVFCLGYILHISYLVLVRITWVLLNETSCVFIDCAIVSDWLAKHWKLRTLLNVDLLPNNGITGLMWRESLWLLDTVHRGASNMKIDSISWRHPGWFPNVGVVQYILHTLQCHLSALGCQFAQSLK